MPAGTGSRIALLVAFLLALPVQGRAEDAATAECERLGDIAELVMHERQHGATMDDLVRIELQQPAELRGVFEVASIAAFAIPIGATEAEREAAAKDFRVFMQDHFCPEAP